MSALVNDIYSFRKEVKQNDYKLNLVYLKIKYEGISAQQSVDEIVVKIKEYYELIEELGKQLKDLDIKSLKEFVNGMIDVIKGTHYWHSICDRYNSYKPYDTQSIFDWFEFDQAYYDLMNRLAMDSKHNLKQVYDWIKIVFNYNCIKGKRMRGLAVVKAFTILAKHMNNGEKVKEEEIELARIMGWIVEISQAMALVLDDIIDGSLTRRGQLTWHLKVWYICVENNYNKLFVHLIARRGSNGYK